MADFTALKTAIQNAIKQNGNEEITGDILQGVLLSMVSTLGDSAINDLVTALANEVAARQDADGTLQQNITNEATARGNADTALSNRLGSTITEENTAAAQIGAEAEARADADTALQGLIDGITNNIENGYVYAGIATPSSTPTTGKVFYLALTAGTYTNFGDIAVTQGINILKYNGSAWSLDAFIGIDDTPTPNSPNLVKSGGAFDSVMTNGSAFDISVHFASGGTLATYANLSAALTALDTLSASYKKGGMSIKFVQSSDNKYVQYRLMDNQWSTTESDWQGVDDEPTAGSENLVKSGGVFDAENVFFDIDSSYYTVEAGWIGEDGNPIYTVDALHRNIPIDREKSSIIKIIPQDGKVAVICFAKSVSDASWILCDNTTRVVIDNESIIAIPSDANYIIVGDRPNGNVSEGYYLPQNMGYSISFKSIINTNFIPVVSHGNLNFSTIENKITWEENLGISYNGNHYVVPANTEGITYERFRFVYVVWDKENNTLTTKNFNNFDGKYLVAAITYTTGNTEFERVCYSILPYTVDGKEYGKDSIQEYVSNMFNHLFVTDCNLQSYQSEYGWIGIDSSFVGNSGSLHKAIPVTEGMTLAITGGENNSYVGFTASMHYGKWDGLGSRIVINAGDTTYIDVPPTAKYLIVGDKANENITEGYYLPSSIQFISSFLRNNSRISSTDLDDWVEVGWYFLDSTIDYTHSPVAHQATLIINYDYKSTKYLAQFLYALNDNIIWVRRRNGAGAWTDWSKFMGADVITDNISYSFTPTSITSQGENKGLQLKVMGYNVAMYNNDTSTYLSDEKIMNFRMMLNDLNPDIVGIQEDRKYIDSNNTKLSLGYLYTPVFPYQYVASNGETTELGPYIHSKMQAVAHGGLFYSNYVTRPKINYATYQIGSKVLLFVSTHTVAHTGGDPSSQEAINARIANYAELFGWVNGTVDLKDIDNNDVHVPTHEWCIIVGDMNTITDTDKTNIKTAASNAGFILGNGGYLGWLKTALRYTDSMTSLDNIIVSSNVVINSYKSNTSWYNKLYSDHTPQVAEVTLLDT